jgi:hypothetical protein
VEVLKSYVESEYGIPMSQQFLFLENLLMMDPLSLLDFAEAKGQPSCLHFYVDFGCCSCARNGDTARVVVITFRLLAAVILHLPSTVTLHVYLLFSCIVYLCIFTNILSLLSLL